MGSHRAAGGAARLVTGAEEMSLTIERVVAGGDGLARHDGLVVFVPRTLEGERVRARVRMRGRLARGELTAVAQPSGARVDAPCVHYEQDECGGCQLQHASYGEQLRIKGALVAEAFRRIARRELPAPAVEPAPNAWRYRRKLTLALRRDDGGWFAGLRRHHDPDAVFALRDCLITSEHVVNVWHAILAASTHFPDAAELRGAVRTLDDGRFSFHLEGGRAWPDADRFFAAVPALEAVWWSPERGRRVRIAARSGHVHHGAAFVQVNDEVARLLRSHVVSIVRAHTPGHVIDAFAGQGDLALQLVDLGMRVTAIEVDRDAARHAALALAPPSTVVAARVEHVLARALPADVVVLNPPRTGVHADVCDVLDRERQRIRAVVYVSCDPATLARDVARLTHWRVARLACFDMFPQTAHVETACELVPEVG